MRSRYFSRPRVFLVLSLLALGVTSCEKSGDTSSSAARPTSESSNQVTKKFRSSFPLPVVGTPSEFIYVSDEYIALLDHTKSHPAAIYKMKAPRSPILFYQQSSSKYGMSPNLHEGGDLVETAEFSDDVQANGMTYHKERVVGSVELTLGGIILSRTLSKNAFSGESTSVQITDRRLTINNVEYSVKVDTGGGYNEMKQSMAVTDSKDAPYRAFAFEEVDGKLSITPLKWDDDPVAVRAGSMTILE